MAKIFCVANQKGGVGKTTTSVNLSAGLAKLNQRVLLVDLDPQGNLEDDLGYADDDRNDQGESLAKALMFGGTVDALVGVRERIEFC